MTKIGVVILNYIAYEATIECINSIKKLKSDDIKLQIVVVDNNSNNDSAKIIKDYYLEDSSVTVHKLDKNLGFAVGNNKGYEIVNLLGKQDYYIFSNDDITIPEGDFFDWIKRCYEKYQFAVLGPDIFSAKGGFHQNPCPDYTRDLDTCRGEIKKAKKELFYLYLDKFRGREYEKKYAVWEEKKYLEEQTDCTLHGSFLVFSKDYFNTYKEPFDNRTFLYGEEDILKLRCDQKYLRTLYSPEYTVYHKQNLSTDMTAGKEIDKRIARVKNNIKSLKIYYLELKKYKGES